MTNRTTVLACICILDRTSPYGTRKRPMQLTPYDQRTWRYYHITLVIVSSTLFRRRLPFFLGVEINLTPPLLFTNRLACVCCARRPQQPQPPTRPIGTAIPIRSASWCGTGRRPVRRLPCTTTTTRAGTAKRKLLVSAFLWTRACATCMSTCGTWTSRAPNEGNGERGDLGGGGVQDGAYDT